MQTYQHMPVATDSAVLRPLQGRLSKILRRSLNQISCCQGSRYFEFLRGATAGMLTTQTDQGPMTVWFRVFERW